MTTPTSRGRETSACQRARCACLRSISRSRPASRHTSVRLSKKSRPRSSGRLGIGMAPTHINLCWPAPERLRPPYPTDPARYAHGRCPADNRRVEGVVTCRFDFDQMRPLGYDVIRLNLSWSLLEPQPGKIDAAYMNRIAQVVRWARARGIYVVLDMHQDAWSKFVYTRGEPCVGDFQSIRGFDGAPLWASRYTSPACALHGVRELDPAVAEQFQKFWLNAPAPDGLGLE